MHNSCKEIYTIHFNYKRLSAKGNSTERTVLHVLQLLCNSKAIISHTKTLLMHNSNNFVVNTTTQHHNKEFIKMIEDLFQSNFISEFTKNQSFLLTFFMQEQEDYNKEAINDAVYLTTQLNDFLIELKEKFNNLTFKNS